jgi:hypothetical protein
MSSVETLLGELDAVREQLLVAIEMLPDEALIQPGVVADWSVADVLVNLTAWESELVTALMQIEQGKRPTRLLAALAAPETHKQAWYTENKGRALDRVFDDWMKVRLELEEWLEMFTDQDLTDKKRYKWLDGRTLAQLITQATIENERRYLPDIARFAQAWVENTMGEDASSAGMIPLTAVTILHPPEE